MNLFDALILGIVEGLTEYLPVSSTGHLILVEHLMGLSETGAAKTFAIAIQLGAILAVLALYWKYFLKKLLSVQTDAKSKRFFINLFISFLPAAVIGLLLGAKIKEHLFTPLWVCAALFTGGVIMIVLERTLAKTRRPLKKIENMNAQDALVIGLCQTVSLWPGFSRAMATILGGRFIGLDITDASEYSFFLALPTLGAATCYEMFKAIKHGEAQFDHGWWVALALGMVVSFIVAALVIKAFLAFLRKYPIAWFGYYRIVLATLLYFILK